MGKYIEKAIVIYYNKSTEFCNKDYLCEMFDKLYIPKLST